MATSERAARSGGGGGRTMPKAGGARAITHLRRVAERFDGKRRLIAFAVAAGYAAILWFNYKTFIYPVFGYMAFVYFNHSPVAVGLDIALAAAPVFYLPLAIRRPSDLALMLLYVIVYIPSVLFTTTVVTIVTQPILMLKLVMFATLGLAQWIAGGDQFRRELLFSFKPGPFMIVLLGIMVAAVGIVGLTYGFRIQLHNLADVYGQRDAFKDELSDAGYNAYLVGLINNVLGPAMVAYGLVFRRLPFVGIGILLALYVFSITGLKSSVMGIFYAFALYFGMAVCRRSFLVPVLLVAAAISILGMIADSAHVADTLNGLLVRRTFMIQGVLTAYYHDFYVQNPFLYLSQSVLAPFMNSPQALSPEDLIGQVYFKSAEHANASFWADGFAQAGVVGMILMSIVVGLFLRAVNYCLSRMDVRFACSAMCMVFYMMTQTGIIKVIGTHGGLLACLIYLQSDLRTRAQMARRDIASRSADRQATRERRMSGRGARSQEAQA